MSYWVSLVDKNEECVKVKCHEEGGTYAVGGSDVASLNVTYNYAWFFSQILDGVEGLHSLDGRRAEECVDKLEYAVSVLGTTRYKDYWAPTPGNAGIALNILLQWARLYPDATFTVH